MGNDACRAGNTSVSIDATNSVGQEDTTTYYSLADNRVGGIVCRRESGKLFFYLGKYGERVNGSCFGINTNWTADVAGTTNSVGIEVLAS